MRAPSADRLAAGALRPSVRPGAAAPRSTARIEAALFAAALVLYAILGYFFTEPDLIWDEARYLESARLLLEGLLAPAGGGQIINGPGYPVFLAALDAVGASLGAMRAFNGVFMALAGWFSYRAVLPFGGPRWALAVALVTVLHPVALYTAPYLMTEAPALCGAAAFAWSATVALQRNPARPAVIALAALALAWLILTRVVFGYVLTALLVFVAALAALQPALRGAWLRVFAIGLGALIVCTPYLEHTRQQTGQWLKWSGNSGELLYWATSSKPGEWGSWFESSELAEVPAIAPEHRAFFDGIAGRPSTEREAALRERAVAQAREDPLGVLKNWGANLARMAFGFPRSHRAETIEPVALVLVNTPIVFATALALFFLLRRPSDFPVAVWLLALATAIFVGGTSLSPAIPRHVIVVWPWVGLVLAAVLSRRLRVEVRRHD